MPFSKEIDFFLHQRPNAVEVNDLSHCMAFNNKHNPYWIASYQKKTWNGKYKTIQERKLTAWFRYNLETKNKYEILLQLTTI